MDAELKTKWINALRGGTYPQGKGFLLLDGEYCCLGVLCDVQGIDWNKLSKDDCNTSYLDGDLLSPYSADLPSEHTKRLATMNDEGSTFGEIADYIEKHL